MNLDVIIVNHNQEDYLKKCLSSLFFSTDKKFNVMVIDNVSHQKTLMVAFWCLFLYGLFNPIVPGSYQVLFWRIRGLLI